jgi:molybdate transport system permease protein
MTAEELTAVWVSLVVASRATLVGLPLATATAWLLARGRFPGRGMLDVLAHAPLVLPPILVGYGLLLLFGGRGPLGAALFALFGVRLAFTSAGASLAAGVCAFPLMVRPARQAFEAIDPGLETAARSLGAGGLDLFCTITLPLAAPGLIAAAVVGFAACLGEFGAVITFAANVPGVTQTLPLAIYSALQTPGGEATAAKLAGVSFALAVVALWLSDRLTARARRWAAPDRP